MEHTVFSKLGAVFLLMVFTLFTKVGFANETSESHQASAPSQLSAGSQKYLEEHDPPVTDQTEQIGKEVDPSFRPALETQREKIEQAEALLDEEINKTSPDLIKVLKLQRTIEKLKNEKDPA